MGRLLRAQNVVQGLVAAAGAGDRIALDATVLSTEQRVGRPVAQAGQLDAIFELQKAVVFDILDALGIVPTQQEREAIMGNRTGNLIAFVAYGRGLEAMDRGDYADALGHFQEAARLDPGFRAARTQRIEAQQVSAAQNIAAIGELATAEIGAAQAGAIAQQVIDQVNHSPAATMTQPVPAAGPSVTTPQDRRPAAEQQRDSPIGAAARATVIIVIPRPGGQP
jgi:tetratricopeptide (TPR) repeat protein